MAGPSKRMKLSGKKLLKILGDSDEFSDSSDFSKSENELPEPESCSSSPSASLSDDKRVTEPCDTWKTVQEKFKPHRVQFSIDDPGPRTNLTNMSTALDFFKLLFTEELLQELVTNTNAYEQQKINALRPLKKNSIWNKWRDVSLEEIKAFIGIITNMGLHDVPDMKDFFTQQWECYISFFSDVMSRMRFFQIFWTFHAGKLKQGQPGVRNITRLQKIHNVVQWFSIFFSWRTLFVAV